MNTTTKISLLVLLCVFGLAHGAGITFKAVSLGVDDDMVLLDIAEQYELSDDMLEALENGVPLTFVTYINMQRQRSLMWNEDMLEMEVKKVLRYHPLSSQYQVDNLHTNTQQMFATRDAALRALGETRDLPLIKEQRLKPDQLYLVDVRTRHEIDALPLPLRPMAYVSPSWRLSSKVWEWQLKP